MVRKLETASSDIWVLINPTLITRPKDPTLVKASNYTHPSLQ
jgi:hypothetical protein